MHDLDLDDGQRALLLPGLCVHSFIANVVRQPACQQG
jgi:hypothetical protein